MEAKPKQGRGSSKQQSQQAAIPALLGQELQSSKVKNGEKTHPSNSEWEGKVGDDAGEIKLEKSIMGKGRGGARDTGKDKLKACPGVVMASEQ